MTPEREKEKKEKKGTEKEKRKKETEKKERKKENKESDRKERKKEKTMMTWVAPYCCSSFE